MARGKTRPTGSDECLSAKAVGPLDETRWRKCLDGGADFFRVVAIALQKNFERLAVREIEAAPSGEQELACG